MGAIHTSFHLKVTPFSLSQPLLSSSLSQTLSANHTSPHHSSIAEETSFSSSQKPNYHLHKSLFLLYDTGNILASCLWCYPVSLHIPRFFLLWSHLCQTHSHFVVCCHYLLGMLFYAHSWFCMYYLWSSDTAQCTASPLSIHFRHGHAAEAWTTPRRTLTLSPDTIYSIGYVKKTRSTFSITITKS